MPRRVQDIDEEIARLKAERVAAIEYQSKSVGAAALNLWPDLPQTKPEIRKYLKAIDTVIRNHIDEFAAVRRGVGQSQTASNESKAASSNEAPRTYPNTSTQTSPYNTNS